MGDDSLCVEERGYEFFGEADFFGRIGSEGFPEKGQKDEEKDDQTGDDRKSPNPHLQGDPLDCQ
jgi:hypothetical protein